MIPGAGPPPDRAWWLARLHPATRLGALPLALVTCFLAPFWALPALLCGAALALRRSGVAWRRLGATARAWWLPALLVVGIHSVTAVGAAPLGHFSWTGVGRGCAALARVAASLLCLQLFVRSLAWGDLVAALAWWGLARGAAAARAGVVLLVALGAAPTVAADGRRIAAALQLRRGAGAAGGRGPRWWRRALDSSHLALPLLEGLFRRAEALTLSLRWRLPQPADLGPPPPRQIGALVAWTGALAVLAVFRGRLT